MTVPDPALVALRTPRYEVVPMRGLESALEALPPGATVTVTCSPVKGLAATYPVLRALIGRGHRAVPHLAARMISGPGELEEVIAELDGLGVRDVFVVAGDAGTPAGPFEGAAALLEAMDRLGHPFTEVGVTGYPESHSFIADDTTVRAMAAKAPYATYLVSQICYDPQTIADWVTAVRARGITQPIHVGIPGVVDRTRLLQISSKIGLADSVRFLSRQPGVAVRAARGYSPDGLVTGLRSLLAEPAHGIVGWHLFTFNEIARTERWRQAMLAAAEGATT
jgi:methylenetetrahydrofolate reductase (NADPH)